jgi:hypothetical protein
MCKSLFLWCKGIDFRRKKISINIIERKYSFFFFFDTERKYSC